MSRIEMNMLRRVTVGDIFRRNAKRYGDKKALIVPNEDGDAIELTWNELNSHINQIANGLKANGIEKGDKVGVFATNCYQFAILIYATMKIGATIAPVSAAVRGDDLLYIINHAEIKLLFVDNQLIPAIKEVEDSIEYIEFGYLNIRGNSEIPDNWIDFDNLLKQNFDEEPKVMIDIEDVASLSYTSGTESHPKAVMMTHGNLTNYLTTFFQWGFVPEDISLHVLPLFYTGGLGTFTAPLLMGQTVVLFNANNPDQIVNIMSEYKTSYVILPPTLWVRLLNNENIEKAAKSIRIGLTFGATIPETMIRNWNKIAPHMSWVTYYGQSETSCSGTVGHFNFIEEIPDRDLGWVGKPYHDLEIKIFDEHDQEVPLGEVGEIVSRGPAVFKGYFKDEKKTKEIFRNGWLHSGDLGRMNEAGDLFFVDRKKDIVKSGGENISTAKIEYVVSSHPKVSEVAAFGVPHPEWMEALAVAIVPTKDTNISAEEIIEHCQKKLPSFQVPKFVISIDDFPRNPTGKILKRELRKQYENLAHT